MIKVKTFFYILAASLLFGAAQSCSSSDDSDDSTTAYNKAEQGGESFLIANRDSAGVKETYTGLQYRVDPLGTVCQA